MESSRVFAFTSVKKLPLGNENLQICTLLETIKAKETFSNFSFVTMYVSYEKKTVMCTDQ